MNEFANDPGSTFTAITRDAVVRYVRRQLRIDPRRSRASIVGSAMQASRGKVDPVMVGEVYDQETEVEPN